jgi:hypothetical protein
MAAVTTNYGFDVPTSSDLVKNGATAISTLGQDLDTFLFRPFTCNAIINGDFSIWQRSTSAAITAGSYVAADRFYTYRGASGSTFSRQTSGLTGFQYSGRVARDSGNTSTSNIAVGQSIETANSLRLAGQTVTLSFYAKAGANFSATSSILRARVLSSTTQDQNIVLNGGTTVIDQNVTLTTSWQRFSYSGAVGSTALTVGAIFGYDPTGTAGAADNFEITGVMVEVGNQVSPFITATGTIQGELAACQRYCLSLNGSVATNEYYGNGYGWNTNLAQILVSMKQTMRTAPSLTYSTTYSKYRLLNDGTAAAKTPTSIGIGFSGANIIGLDVGATGIAAGQMWFFSANASDSYLLFSAEL